MPPERNYSQRPDRRQKPYTGYSRVPSRMFGPEPADAYTRADTLRHALEAHRAASGVHENEDRAGRLPVRPAPGTAEEQSWLDRQARDLLTAWNRHMRNVDNRAQRVRAVKRYLWATRPDLMLAHEPPFKDPVRLFAHDMMRATTDPIIRVFDPDFEDPGLSDSFVDELVRKKRFAGDELERIRSNWLADRFSLPTPEEQAPAWGSPLDYTYYLGGGIEGVEGNWGGRLDAGGSYSPHSRVMTGFYSRGGNRNPFEQDPETAGLAFGAALGGGIAQDPYYLIQPAFVSDLNFPGWSVSVATNDPYLGEDTLAEGRLALGDMDVVPRQVFVGLGEGWGGSQIRTRGDHVIVDASIPPDYWEAFLDESREVAGEALEDVYDWAAEGAGDAYEWAGENMDDFYDWATGGVDDAHEYLFGKPGGPSLSGIEAVDGPSAAQARRKPRVAIERRRAAEILRHRREAEEAERARQAYMNLLRRSRGRAGAVSRRMPR